MDRRHANDSSRPTPKDQRPVNDDTIDQLEMSVIGAVVIDANTLALLPTLEVDDFQNVRPRFTWEAIRNLEATHLPIDLTTIGDELAKCNRLNAVGYAWLGECALRVPTAANAIEYARRLKDADRKSVV